MPGEPVPNLLTVLADADDLNGIVPPGPYNWVEVNLPLSKELFVMDAVELCRPGGTIHLYMLESSEGKPHSRLCHLPIGDVRSGGAGDTRQGSDWLAVYDITISES